MAALNPNARPFVMRAGAAPFAPAAAETAVSMDALPSAAQRQDKAIEVKDVKDKPVSVPDALQLNKKVGKGKDDDARPEGKREEQLKPHDPREHLNIVFIGHVDAGKSTISGQIMVLTGQVDARSMAKLQQEAIELKRESWALAYVMDTNEEERSKAITVEVGRARFETKNKRYTLLDAPGHKTYVPNMIGGASQADVAVLVISARKGEFETGFEKGGQTREHALLAKTLGIRRLIVAVNKMDDPSVQWSKERYDAIVAGLTPFLEQCGYNVKKGQEVTFLPVAGFSALNMQVKVSEKICPWWRGDSLMNTLDALPSLERDFKSSLRVPIITRYKEMGVIYVLGKIETGTVCKNSELLLMPNNKKVQCTGLLVDDTEVDMARAGENLLLRIKGCDEEEIQAGFVFSDVEKPVRKSKEFEAQVVVLPLLEHKPIITTGYQCILHVHNLAMECQITKMTAELDKKTGKPKPSPPAFMRAGGTMICQLMTDQTIAIESFKDCAPLGRFTLRDEGKTIAIGKILRIKDAK